MLLWFLVVRAIPRIIDCNLVVCSIVLACVPLVCLVVALPPSMNLFVHFFVPWYSLLLLTVIVCPCSVFSCCCLAARQLAENSEVLLRSSVISSASEDVIEDGGSGARPGQPRQVRLVWVARVRPATGQFAILVETEHTLDQHAVLTDNRIGDAVKLSYGLPQLRLLVDVQEYVTSVLDSCPTQSTCMVLVTIRWPVSVLLLLLFVLLCCIVLVLFLLRLVIDLALGFDCVGPCSCHCSP
jgi:hypothetical protein